MQLTRLRGLLKNLKGEILPYMRREFVPKDVAHRALMEASGENFPLDAIEEWERWVKAKEPR